MRPYRLTRAALESLPSDAALVLAQDVRDAAGAVVAHKGAYLTNDARQGIALADWSELHAIILEPGDVHETEAGRRVSAAVAGRNVTVGGMTAGHWPLMSATRGVVAIDTDCLQQINALDGIALYTLFDGQVVAERETVARAKIVPFAVADATVTRAEQLARAQGGAVHIRRFVPTRAAAIIVESLGERAIARAHAVLAEKVAWFGSTLLPARHALPDHERLAAAVRDVSTLGAQLVIVAGARPMDPLDPAYAALADLGANLERQGMPAHPGSLLWLAYLPATQTSSERTVIGLPSCGLFSQASVFDLLLPRILAGERLTNNTLAALGHGGLLTRDMQFRFPPYRSGARRGEVLEE
ncbi:MAG TPA: hypothetical protein VJ717_07710 [Gemmatimonadaceae bacterium]|nr:hypothetical protein [Gemmatimonadaceae bacterium]